MSMLFARLICSDEDCAVVVEALADSLEDLDALLCDDCGCTLQVLGVAGASEVRALAARRAARRPAHDRAAA
jgi:hypothetical protein